MHLHDTPAILIGKMQHLFDDQHTRLLSLSSLYLIQLISAVLLYFEVNRKIPRVASILRVVRPLVTQQIFCFFILFPLAFRPG